MKGDSGSGETAADDCDDGKGGVGRHFDLSNEERDGREGAAEGLDEYLETKTVWIELSGATRDPFTIG